MHKTERTIKEDGNGEATTRIQPAEVMAILEDGSEDTTALHRYAPKTPRVSWIRRILNWFRRD